MIIDDNVMINFPMKNCLLKFTELPKTPEMTSKKHSLQKLSLKGISRFCANLDETKADMV